MNSFRAASFTDRLLHGLLTRTVKYRDIEKTTEEGTTLYLRRFYLFRTKMFPNFRIFLHYINRSDNDRDLHDHPFDFTTLVLSNGYTETIRGEYGPWHRSMGLWATVHNKAEHTHRVTLHGEKPTWTILRVWGARRVWGFWTKKGWVAWRDYLGLSPAEQPDALEDV